MLSSYWYLVNIVKTGKFDGKIANPQNATTVEHGSTYSFLGTIAISCDSPIDAFDRRARSGGSVRATSSRQSSSSASVAGPRTRRTWLVAAGAALVAVCVTWRWIDHELLLAYQKVFVRSTGATSRFSASTRI